MTQNPILRASWFLALLALVASAVHAAPITVPTDLNVGDQYRLAFVTSTARDATSSNIDDYNDFVTAVAESVPQLLSLNTTWTAIASTLTVDALDNTNTDPDVEVGVPIYLLNDTLLVNDNFDIWDGSIANMFNINESGEVRATSWVWTGTHAHTGAKTALGYLGRTPNATVGQNNVTFEWWSIYTDTKPSTTQFPLYAVSGRLTVIPEPGTAALMLMGLAVLALRGHRQRH